MKRRMTVIGFAFALATAGMTFAACGGGSDDSSDDDSKGKKGKDGKGKKGKDDADDESGGGDSKGGIKAHDKGKEPKVSDKEKEAAEALAKKAAMPWIQDGLAMSDFGSEDGSKEPKVLAYLAYTSKDAKVVIAAVRQLERIAWMGDEKEHVPFSADYKDLLMGLMTDADDRIAGAAVYSAGTVLKEDEDVQKLLLEICAKHGTAVIRAAACDAASLHPKDMYKDKDTFKVLYDALEDKDTFVVARTLRVLSGWTGAEGAPADAVDRVWKLADSKDDAVRGLAIGYLLTDANGWSAKPEAVKKAKEAGLKALKDKNAFVRAKAAMGLAAFVSKDWKGMDDLMPLLEDEDNTEATIKYTPLNIEGAFDAGTDWKIYAGGKVWETVLSSLEWQAEGAKGHEFKATKKDDWPKVRDEFKAWWKDNGDALKKG
jgi:hypothetical protein